MSSELCFALLTMQKLNDCYFATISQTAITVVHNKTETTGVWGTAATVKDSCISGLCLFLVALHEDWQNKDFC